MLLAPDIQGLFESMASGGTQTIISALRYSIDDDIIAFLDKYDNASEHQKKVMPLQAFVLSCGMECNKFIGAAILALRDHSINQVKLLAISNHPEVMRARIDNAKRPEGVKDREAIDLMLGALPTPKGATFITKQYITSGTAGEVKQIEGQADEVEEMSSEDQLDFLFPSLTDTQKKLTSNTRMLNPASEEDELAVLEALINGAACTLSE